MAEEVRSLLYKHDLSLDPRTHVKARCSSLNQALGQADLRGSLNSQSSQSSERRVQWEACLIWKVEVHEVDL